MINLIPPDGRHRIITEYWVRVLTVWLFLLAATAALVAVFFLPAFVLVASQVSVHSKAADEVRASVNESETTARALIEASEQAQLIIENERAGTLVSVIDTVEAAVASAGVSVSRYEVSRVAAGVAPVQINGQAANRATLAAFRDALLTQPRIAAVNLPISNFAQDRDIDFALTLTIASSSQALP